MSSFGLAIGLVLFSVAANGFFAGAETGFTAARRIVLVHRARRGHRLAGMAARLLKNRESVIVTTVVGNNVAVVTGTAIATAACLQRFGDAGESVAAISMMVLNVIFGEVLPKSFFRSRPEAAISWSAPAVRAAEWLLWPARWFSLASVRLLVWLLRAGDDQLESALSRERILHMFSRSARQQELAASEEELVTRFARGVQLQLKHVMTPLAEVSLLREGARVGDALELVRQGGHSRLPLLDETGDLPGLVLFRDLLRADPAHPVDDYLREMTMLSVHLGVDEGIAAIAEGRSHLAAVVDDHGAAVGIVSLEDLVEPLVGEIADEHDPKTWD